MSIYDELCFTGVQVDIPGFGQKTIQVKLLCAILDLPAKASLLNCNQYNGSFGCNTCKHPGVSVSSNIAVIIVMLIFYRFQLEGVEVWCIRLMAVLLREPMRLIK